MKASHSGCGSLTSRHRERPADAVQVVLAALLVLGAAEIRQHVVEAPARIAELAPVVEVLGLSADVEQPVDRRGAAHHLAARLDDRAAAELGLGLGIVEPVVARVGEQLGVADRHVDPEIAVLAAGFEQQHAMAAGSRSGGWRARSPRCRRRRRCSRTNLLPARRFPLIVLASALPHGTTPGRARTRASSRPRTVPAPPALPDRSRARPAAPGRTAIAT